MPIYKYKCKECGHTFEKFQSIIDDPITNCEKCNGKVYRLISKNVNFILKGSGFYSTDNPNASRKSEKKKLTTTSKEGKNKKELSGKTESKTTGKEEKQISTK
ncbi:MAG: FmdB family zinc ribbon protein [Candidatus Caldatribacteriota bacterium]|nr:FmdB family zinc ribbon protein [Candidatus Caldatribacteriota bacterium]